MSPAKMKNPADVHYFPEGAQQNDNCDYSTPTPACHARKPQYCLVELRVTPFFGAQRHSTNVQKPVPQSSQFSWHKGAAGHSWHSSGIKYFEHARVRICTGQSTCCAHEGTVHRPLCEFRPP